MKNCEVKIMFKQNLKEMMLDKLDQLTDLFIQTIAKDINQLTSEVYYLNYTNLNIDNLYAKAFIFTSNQNDLTVSYIHLFNIENQTLHKLYYELMLNDTEYDIDYQKYFHDAVRALIKHQTQLL